VLYTFVVFKHWILSAHWLRPVDSSFYLKKIEWGRNHAKQLREKKNNFRVAFIPSNKLSNEASVLDFHQWSFQSSINGLSIINQCKLQHKKSNQNHAKSRTWGHARFVKSICFNAVRSNESNLVQAHFYANSRGILQSNQSSNFPREESLNFLIFEHWIPSTYSLLIEMTHWWMPLVIVPLPAHTTQCGENLQKNWSACARKRVILRMQPQILCIHCHITIKHVERARTTKTNITFICSSFCFEFLVLLLFYSPEKIQVDGQFLFSRANRN